jgi:hypothetical protein
LVEKVSRGVGVGVVSGSMVEGISVGSAVGANLVGASVGGRVGLVVGAASTAVVAVAESGSAGCEQAARSRISRMNVRCLIFLLNELMKIVFLA